MSTAEALVQKLLEEDVIGQLLRREGRMAQLGSEHGVLKLDWVDEVAMLLAERKALEGLERSAQAMWLKGIRHVVWSGMGGSGVTVSALTDLGICSGAGGGIALSTLDSTDPAALNSLVGRLAADKGLSVDASRSTSVVHDLLEDVAMVAVSMGATSEEPVTHLSWFVRLLEAAGLPPVDHCLVLTVPGSYLERFAVERGLEARPVPLGPRAGFPGRMSAPGTAVFLLPAALHFAGPRHRTGHLQEILAEAWRRHDLGRTRLDRAPHPYLRMAAAIAAASQRRACRLQLRLPQDWEPLQVWIEQLLEQSLGKDGRGVVVFSPQRLRADAPAYRNGDLVHAQADDDRVGAGPETVSVPPLEPFDTRVPERSLGAVAAVLLGWQLTAAVIGYLHDTNFVDEPAVENYKARARELRALPDVLATVAAGAWADRVVWFGRRSDPAHGLEPIARSLCEAAVASDDNSLSYLDLTVNGELARTCREAVAARLHTLGNDLLGVPVKLRRAPAAYHVSEQSEMDGPGGIVSIRAVGRDSGPPVLGGYDAAFLQAQAVAGWQAMNEQGRVCFLLVLDSLHQIADAMGDLEHRVRRGLLDQVRRPA